MEREGGLGKHLAHLGSALSWNRRKHMRAPLQGLPAQQGDGPLAGSGVDGTASHRESDPKRGHVVVFTVDFYC